MAIKFHGMLLELEMGWEVVLKNAIASMGRVEHCLIVIVIMSDSGMNAD